MNHFERGCWRAGPGARVKPDETASGRGRNGGKAMAVATLLAALGLGAPAFGMPQGGVVSAGQGVIALDGTTTTVTQQSGRLAVNWNSFGIGANETVRFVQPGAGAVALNRVLGAEASAIYGRLQANGQVFLLNPNGILFGASAQVNVGGLVASTLGLGDADFLAGRYRFTSTGLSPAGVTNQGRITASDGGYVALLGGQISNQGTIVARLGSVALAAGSDIALDFAGDGLLGVTVNRGALDALVHNGQAIHADGGQVLMTARAADDIVRAAVNNEGVVEARALENRAGRIVLAAEGAKAEVHLGGTLDASGGGRVLADAHAGDLSVDGRVDVSNTQGVGGTAHLLGGRVGLFGSARVDAGGRDGGGTVLVGGDFQGKNADVHNARQTALSADARIDASATGQGNGGRVIVWSDGQTVAQGAITARGGANGGNGGFVEVSGKDTLHFSSQVDTTAAKGSMGTLLLDPTDIDVIDCIGGPCGFNTPIIGFGDLPSGGDSTVRGATLSAATTNVSLQATNSINFYDPVSVTTAGLSLTAEAGNAINVYGTIHAPGSITLKAPSVFISSNVDAGEHISLLADGLAVSGGASALVNAPSVTIKPYSAGFGLNIGGSASGSALTISTGTLGGISANATLTLQGRDVTLNTVLNRAGDTVMAADRAFTNTIANGMSSGGRYLVYATDPGTTTRNVTSGFSKHYEVTYTGTTPAYASAGNWFFYSVAPTLQVHPDGGTVVYGSAVPGGYALGAGGFIDGDNAASAGVSGTVTFGLPMASYSSGGHLNVGTYGMDYAGGLLSSLGYRFVSAPGSLSVTPATVAVAAAPVTKVYDGTTTASLGTVAFAGMLAGDSLGLTGSLHFADPNAARGKMLAASVVLSGADAANYLLTAPTLTGDITPARLQVRALDDSRVAGGMPYQGGAGVAYDGFVAGESTAVLGGQLHYGGTAQGASTAGRYTITASGLQAINYDIRYADGTLLLREQASVQPSVPAPTTEAPATPKATASAVERYRSGVLSALSAVRDESSRSDDAPAEMLTVVGSGMRLPEGLVGE